MLNSLRESAGSWIVKIFLGLLILSFAAWGIEDVFRFQPDADVATVGDQSISGPELINRFDRQVQRMRAQFGPTFDQEQARRLGFVDQILQQLITDRLYDQQAWDLDLIATDDEVRRQIQEEPAFRDNLGNFSRLQYENGLRQVGYTEQQYVAVLKGAIARNQLLEAATFAAKSPDFLNDAIYNYQFEQRVLEVVSVRAEAMASPPTPGEDAISRYYTENESAFMAPEFRELTFLTLSTDDVAASIGVSDVDIEEAYQERLAEFTTEETRNIDQIVVQDEELAKSIAARIKEGGDFYAVAKELAGLEQEAVSLGVMRRLDMPDAIGGPAFALSENAVSDPVQSPFGWHVLRATNIAQGGTRSIADVREELVLGIQRERAIDSIYDLSIRIEDMLAGGTPVEEIAESLGLTHGRIAEVDSFGRNRDDQPVDGLPAAPGFLQKVFEAEQGEDPALNEATDGSYYIVRVDTVIPPALRPIDEVRTRIMAALIEAEQGKLAQAEAERIRAAAEGGDTLASLATEGGHGILTTEAIVRNQSQSQANLSTELASAAYKAPVNGIVTGPSRDAQAHLVVQVKEIKPAASGDASPGRAQIRQAVAQSFSEDLLHQFTEALRGKFAVEIHDQQIDALFDEVNVRR